MAPLTDYQKRIDEICFVLDSFRRGQSNSAAFNSSQVKTEDGQIYQRALETLNSNPDAEALELLRGAEFKPFLLMNGLIFFSSLKPEFRNEILQVLSSSLKEFSSYYGYKEGFLDHPPTEDEERRWMSFMLAYLPAAGMDLLGIFMTLKGDCIFEETKYALRDILEGDEQVLTRSQLFPEVERSLLQEILETNTLEAWEKLRTHLVGKYALPQLAIRPLPRG